MLDASACTALGVLDDNLLTNRYLVTSAKSAERSHIQTVFFICQFVNPIPRKL